MSSINDIKFRPYQNVIVLVMLKIYSSKKLYSLLFPFIKTSEILFIIHQIE